MEPNAPTLSATSAHHPTTLLMRAGAERGTEKRGRRSALRSGPATCRCGHRQVGDWSRVAQPSILGCTIRLTGIIYGIHARSVQGALGGGVERARPALLLLAPHWTATPTVMTGRLHLHSEATLHTSSGLVLHTVHATSRRGHCVDGVQRVAQHRRLLCDVE